MSRLRTRLGSLAPCAYPSGGGRRPGHAPASRLLRRLSSTAVHADAVTPWRSIASAPVEQRAAWEASDRTLHARMREHVPAALAHNGEEAFDNHLVGVQSVLRAWGSSESLCNAGLFHSIYGTEGFQGYKLPLSHRGEIAQLIGAEAERLSWIFCMVDRASVDATALSPPAPASVKVPTFCARPELGAFDIQLRSETEWVSFLTLTLADWLEQVEGAARKANPTAAWDVGEAWAYRREAYAAMAKLLGERYGIAAAPRMHAEVYAREPEKTQQLVQPQVPPMSEAAREAREAMASSELSFEDGAPADVAAFLEHRVVLEWKPTPRPAASAGRV